MNPGPDSSDHALAGHDEAWEAWLASRERCEDDEPLEFEDEGDYYDDPAELAEITTEARQASADQAAAEAHIAASGQTAALAAGASVALGRRGPGMPGSAEPLAGEYSGPGGAFATGQALDVAPGGQVLLGHADWAAGDDERFGGVSDDELLGIVCAADRCEAAASALKHTAVAELIRRRPASGCTPQGAAGMPEAWDEFTRAELAPALGESRYAVDGLLDLAHDLTVKLPGTMALFRVGVISRYKAQVISHATQLLDPAEARAAEAMVLDRAGRLTPGALRAAIARAVMEVAPEKARKRREKAAKSADVQQWAEFSGNAALAGRELPPADVLAAGQRIDSWADQLKAAGLEGSAGELRARAFLDLLLGKDSRPDQAAADGKNPAAFAATINLTIPLATLLDLANRPGEIPGIGPIDPWLARDLARTAASHPKTKWCVTVTDKQGHAIGHGCARPEPRGARKNPGVRKARDRRGTPSPPRISMGRPAGTAPGGCAPRETGRSCGSASTRSTSRIATTGTRPAATIPGSSSGTCPRSGTPRVPGPAAVGRQPARTSSTTSPTRPADGRACATAARNVATTTGSSSTRNGRSTSSRTARSGGPPRPGVSTPPSPRGTPRERDRAASRAAAARTTR
jgi:hypothetical protein